MLTFDERVEVHRVVCTRAQPVHAHQGDPRMRPRVPSQVAGRQEGLAACFADIRFLGAAPETRTSNRCASPLSSSAPGSLNRTIEPDTRNRPCAHGANTRHYTSEPARAADTEQSNKHICVRAARPSGPARCGAGVGCSAIRYQSLRTRSPNPLNPSTLQGYLTHKETHPPRTLA